MQTLGDAVTARTRLLELSEAHTESIPRGGPRHALAIRRISLTEHLFEEGVQAVELTFPQVEGPLGERLLCQSISSAAGATKRLLVPPPGTRQPRTIRDISVRVLVR